MRLWVSGPRIGVFRLGVSIPLRARPHIVAPPRRGAGGYVYVLEGAHGHQKIGKSVDPEARRSTLQTGSPVTLTVKHTAFAGPYAERVEKGAHSILDAARLPGEWFDVSTEAAIAAVYAAAATLGVTLGEDYYDDTTAGYYARIRRYHRVKWALFAIGMAIFTVTLHYLVTPR